VEDHRDSLVGELGVLDLNLEALKKRNHLYQSFIKSEYGTL
jgi:hypothetical protein